MVVEGPAPDDMALILGINMLFGCLAVLAVRWGVHSEVLESGICFISVYSGLEFEEVCIYRWMLSVLSGYFGRCWDEAGFALGRVRLNL